MTVRRTFAANPFAPSTKVLDTIPGGLTVLEGCPEGMESAPTIHAYVNGEEIERSSWSMQVLRRGDHVAYLIQPAGPETWAFIGQALLAAAISYVVGLLFPPPDIKNPERDEQRSETYTFTGASASRSEGLPLSMIFGKIKVGGMVINEYVDTQGFPSKSTLHQQVCYGEGPVNAIGGISVDTPIPAPLTGAALPENVEVDGNELQNYQGVEAWVRLGDNTPDAVPGFEDVRNTYTVDQALLATEQTSTDISGLTNIGVATYSAAGNDPYDSTNDAFWTANGVEFDLDTADVDAGVVRVHFPDGLFTQDSGNGSIGNSHFGWQIRYRELNSGGSPITSGGFAGDGYVRVKPVLPTAVNHYGPFDISPRVQFVDPQTYQPGAAGSAADVDGVAASFLTGTQATGYPTGLGLNIANVSCWVYADANQFDGTQEEIVVAGDFHVSQGVKGQIGSIQKGWTFGFKRFSGKYHPFLLIGHGAWVSPTDVGFQEFGLNANAQGTHDIGTGEGVWHHYAFSYTPFGNGICRVYYNGAQVGSTTVTNIRNMALSPAALRVGRMIDTTTFPVATGFDGRVDSLAFSTNVGWSQATAAGIYNGGVGQTVAPPGSRGHWLFDDTAPAAIDTDIVDPYWGDLAASGSATSGTAGGVVTSGFAGATKRSKFRVEVLRINNIATSIYVSNKSQWLEVQGILDSELSYPNAPTLAIKVPANDQLNNSIPNSSAVITGLDAAVWDGQSTVSPTVSYEWSDNPAWVCLAFSTNKRWGLGQHYDLKHLVNSELLEWADRCDEVVYDGTPVYSLDDSGFDDIQFFNDTVDENSDIRGSLTILIQKANAADPLPASYKVGGFIRLHGCPMDDDHANINNDVNNGALGDDVVGGYEIKSIVSTTSGANKWIIDAYWDRLDETDPWTSGQKVSAILGAFTLLADARMTTGEARYRLNGVVDRQEPSWDLLVKMAAVGRAVPIREGRSIRFKFARDQDPVGLITQAAIEKDSFKIQFTGPSQKPNSIDYTIADEDYDYELVPIPIDDDRSIENAITATEDLRKKTGMLWGVTSRSQAERQGRYELNVNRLIKRQGEFRMGPQGLQYQAGDVVRIGHDLVNRGKAGRVPVNVTQQDELLDSPTDFTSADWTLTGTMTRTADQITDPFGDSTISDLLDDTSALTHSKIVATSNKSAASLDPDWYSFGGFVNRINTQEGTRLTMSWDGAEVDVNFNYASGSGDDETTGLDGSRYRYSMQKLGASGWYFIQVAIFCDRASSGSIDVAIYPASAAASPEAETGGIYASRFSLGRGRYASPTVGPRSVILDRDITFVGSDHDVFAHNFHDRTNTSRIDATFYTDGETLGIGDILILEDSLGFSLFQRDSYMVVGDDTPPLLVELAMVRSNSDMSRDIKFVEFNGAVFNDGAKLDQEESAFAGGPGDNKGDTQGSGPGNVSPNTVPDAPLVNAVYDILVRRGPGDYVPVVTLAWSHHTPHAHLIGGSEVYYRLHSVRPAAGTDTQDWSMVAAVSGLDTVASVRIPDARATDLIELSVVAVSMSGRKASPSNGARSMLKLSGLPAPPTAPTGVGADLSVDVAVYAWTSPDDDDLRTEVRRGGANWILSPRVFRTPPAADGSEQEFVTRDWAGSSFATPTLHFASLSSAGAYSEAATTTFDPVPETDEFGFDGHIADEQWETFDSNGWVRLVPITNDPVIGADFEQDATNGWIQYKTSYSGVDAWVTAYKTGEDASFVAVIDQGRPTREVYLEAYLDAEHVDHMTWIDADFTWGDLREQRRHWEGPRYTVEGETGNTEMRIQFRINEGGGNADWSGWRTFTPGRYRVVDVQFRVQFRRHDAGQDVRLKALHTRISAPHLSADQATPRRRFEESDLN